MNVFVINTFFLWLILCLAYNAEEYQAWVNGFNNLLMAMKYPTPYDFKACTVIERSTHSHQPYEVVLILFYMILHQYLTFND